MKKIEFQYELNSQDKYLIEQLYTKLSEDERVQLFLLDHHLDAAFLKRHISKFNTWIMELDDCQACKGLVYCNKKNNGKRLDIRYDDALLFVEAACQFMIDKKEKEQYLSNFLIRDIPDSLASVSLKDINIKGESGEYIAIVKELVLWLKSQKQEVGYYLYGDVGVGKTFLLACIANDYAKLGKKIAFVHMPTFATRIRSLLEDKTAFEKELYRLKNVDLLVLDDIGAENGSAWFRDEIILPILNYRMENRSATCFTSNLSQKQLEIHFKYMRMKTGSGEEINASRIAERVRALSKEMKLEGHNRRSK